MRLARALVVAEEVLAPHAAARLREADGVHREAAVPRCTRPSGWPRRAATAAPGVPPRSSVGRAVVVAAGGHGDDVEQADRRSRASPPATHLLPASAGQRGGDRGGEAADREADLGAQRHARQPALAGNISA